MSNIMEFEDFIADIKYSSDDEIFYGKIEGINDLISFEGRSVKELKEAFKDAVEDYKVAVEDYKVAVEDYKVAVEDYKVAVEDYKVACKELNKEPIKSYKGSFNVRISSELHRKAMKKALVSGSSLNSIIKEALTQYVES